MEKNLTNKVLELTKQLQSLSDEELKSFLELNGLFHIYEAGVEHYLDSEESESDILYENLSEIDSNKLKKVSERFIKYVKSELQPNTYYCINKKELMERRTLYLGQTKEMLEVDSISTGADKLLILVDKAEYQKLIDMYKEYKEKGYSKLDVWNPNYSICKAMLPKLLQEYSEQLHGTPKDLTMEQWRSIIMRMIWFCNEMVTNHDELLIAGDIKKMEEYNNYLSTSKDLFCKYFFDLWD